MSASDLFSMSSAVYQRLEHKGVLVIGMSGCGITPLRPGVLTD